MANTLSLHDALPIFLQAHHQETIKRVAGRDGEVILQPIVGVQPLVIFGGGHIARALSRIASIAGFTVTVIDDREEYANSGRFPEAAQTLVAEIDEAFQQIPFNSSTSIVIVTRGHSTDEAILERAVKTSARYIGMIGSTKKVITTYSQLRKQGVPIPLLKRVAAPIGLDIGAVSAEEIAVSILAEVIQVRRGRPVSTVAMSDRIKAWFDGENR
jgi:xanthine dehydrogenase accessory factor